MGTWAVNVHVLPFSYHSSLGTGTGPFLPSSTPFRNVHRSQVIPVVPNGCGNSV